MLTKDKLKGVELLKELTPEQLEVIENMSKQDENEVIGEKTKLFYDNLVYQIREINCYVFLKLKMNKDVKVNDCYHFKVLTTWAGKCTYLVSLPSPTDLISFNYWLKSQFKW